MFRACSRSWLGRRASTWRRSTTWIRCTPKRVATGSDMPPDRQRRHRLLELGHERSGRGPAEVAALRGAAVLRVLARQLLEASCAPRDDLALELRAGGAPRPPRSARPKAAAGCAARASASTRERAAVPALDQLEDVKAGAAAQQLGRDLAGLQAAAPRSTNRSGSRSTGRRPISPPWAAVGCPPTSRAPPPRSPRRRERAPAPPRRGRAARRRTASAAPSGTVHQDLRHVDLRARRRPRCGASRSARRSRRR